MHACILTHQVIEFYRYVLSASHTLDDQRFMRDLPEQMTMRLLVDTHRPLIANCPLFRVLDNTSVLLLLKRLQPVMDLLDCWLAAG